MIDEGIGKTEGPSSHIPRATNSDPRVGSEVGSKDRLLRINGA